MSLKIYLKVGHKKAFSLIDTIMAVSVLAIAIIGIGGLTLASIRANQFNENRLRAYYLAVEGLEGIRNMRDSNWLQNYEWNGQAVDDGLDEQEIGQPYIFRISPDPNDPAIYLLERNLNFPTDGAVPWRWQYFQNRTAYDAANPQVDFIPATRCNLALNNLIGCGPQQDPFFRRFVEISYQGAGNEIMNVEAVVLWNERGFPRELRIATQLTNWRQGPL